MPRSDAFPDEEPKAHKRTSVTASNYTAKDSFAHAVTASKEPTETKPEAKAIDLQGVPLHYYEEMKEIFKIFDADGSGAIDPKEIREQMIALGFTVDNTTIYQLISDLDSDGSQKLEFDEFFGMLRDTLEIHKPSSTSRHDFLQIFDFLDDLDPKNRDGKIDTSNLRRLANVLGDDITDGEIEHMVSGADPDDKGYVLPEEFYHLMVNCATRMETDPPLILEATSATSDEALEPTTPRREPVSPKGRRSISGIEKRSSLAKLRRSVTSDSMASNPDSERKQRKSKTTGSMASMDWSQRGSVRSSLTAQPRMSLADRRHEREQTEGAGRERKSVTMKERHQQKNADPPSEEVSAESSSGSTTKTASSAAQSYRPGRHRSILEGEELGLVPEGIDEGSLATGMD